MYHFLNGYTAKVAGTEAGITEPTTTFSTCFGAPFLPLHPSAYAKLLGEKIDKQITLVLKEKERAEADASKAADQVSWRAFLLAQVDAGIGMTSGAPTGASLGGGLRVRLGTSHLLAGVRGGLGQGGAEIFGRYNAFVGYEWVQK